MDIRIVNTCNNNCMYCLEQSLRTKEKFISKQEIFTMLEKNETKEILSFYGGNSLLHPDLDEIIFYARELGFSHVSLLTNTLGISNERIKKLKESGLTGINFYFNTISSQGHNAIVQGGISLKELLKNIEIIQNSKLHCKAIIHINKQNISSLYKTIFILHTRFGVKNFDFVNYFPFDRPYDLYREDLSYDISENRKNINNIFKIINKLSLEVKFLKFSKDFFGEIQGFYSLEDGVLNQIGPEDVKRLEGGTPFCYKEKRCQDCFIKDHCNWYDTKNG